MRFLISVAITLAIIFMAYRLYIDAHCTMILGTQVCQ